MFSQQLFFRLDFFSTASDDRNSQWGSGDRSNWTSNAKILFVRQHRQHHIKDGNHGWTRQDQRERDNLQVSSIIQLRFAIGEINWMRVFIEQFFHHHLRTYSPSPRRTSSRNFSFHFSLLVWKLIQFHFDIDFPFSDTDIERWHSNLIVRPKINMNWEINLCNFLLLSAHHSNFHLMKIEMKTARSLEWGKSGMVWRKLF